MQTRKPIILLSGALMWVLILTGCGIKGPLYLPDNKPSSAETASP
ncbi:MAG TPA: lipoprotein [Coxiellaceae bacterium]|nr:lipoprotein [Coxiellaceae bacterium]